MLLIIVYLCIVNFKDANGSTINVPNLRIAFSNMNSQPLPITKERSRLYDSVNITTETNNIVVKIGNILNYNSTKMYDI